MPDEGRVSERLEDDLGVRVPAAGWQILDDLRARRFTGEVTLVGSPAARAYFDCGRIYFAESHGAPPLAAVLVARRLVTSDELELGVVRVNGHDHLGRLFERAPSISADAVRVAVAELTQQVVQAVAGQTVAAVAVVPYAFHPSGVHLWQASPIPAPAAPVQWDRPAAPGAVYDGLELDPTELDHPAGNAADHRWAVSGPEVPAATQDAFAVIWPNGAADAPNDEYRPEQPADHAADALDLIAEAWLAAESETGERRFNTPR